jgi:hypothetical protein
VSGNVSDRFCLKVTGQVENDMILGTSAYMNGIRATSLRPEIDAGIGYYVGGTMPQVVRTFYLDLPATERVATRARQLRQAAGTLTGVAAGVDEAEAARDVQADLAAVRRRRRFAVGRDRERQGRRAGGQGLPRGRRRDGRRWVLTVREAAGPAARAHGGR